MRTQTRHLSYPANERRVIRVEGFCYTRAHVHQSLGIESTCIYVQGPRLTFNAFGLTWEREAFFRLGDHPPFAYY